NSSLKTGESECELGKQNQRDDDDKPGISVNTRVVEKCLLPFRKVRRMSEELKRSESNHNRVQQQIDSDERYSNSNRFFESAQENYAEHCNERQGDADLMFKKCRSKWILDHVGRRVSSRERDRDNEIGSDESQQHEHEEFPLPT